MLFTKTGVKRLEKGGTILGLFELATFEEDTITVEPGDILVAFSDGVTEALSASGDEYGEDRLIACVDAAKGKSLQELLDAIFISVREFCTGAVQSDDVTALVLRYDG
jgi:sigma-B regulation protein RsbU (phosphoserine phosphatase)